MASVLAEEEAELATNDLGNGAETRTLEEMTIDTASQSGQDSGYKSHEEEGKKKKKGKADAVVTAKPGVPKVGKTTAPKCAKVAPMKKPGAATSFDDDRVLGCSKCRYLKHGCAACRPAGFPAKAHKKYHLWT